MELIKCSGFVYEILTLLAWMTHTDLRNSAFSNSPQNGPTGAGSRAGAVSLPFWKKPHTGSHRRDSGETSGKKSVCNKKTGAASFSLLTAPAIYTFIPVFSASSIRSHLRYPLPEMSASGSRSYFRRRLCYFRFGAGGAGGSGSVASSQRTSSSSTSAGANVRDAPPGSYACAAQSALNFTRSFL